MFSTTERWKSLHPGATVGMMVLNDVANPKENPALEERKQELVNSLRERHAGQDRTGLKSNPTLQAYRAYYDRYKKTYHVQLQLESVVFKGRPLPSVAALVEAMFMAELDTLLLTAGHDLDSIQGNLTLDAASGNESYTLLNGQVETVKPDDMMVRDEPGVISSIIYGPDQRTQIQASTTNALFTVYAPAGIGRNTVQQHFEEIEAIVRLFSPLARSGGVKMITGG